MGDLTDIFGPDGFDPSASSAPKDTPANQLKDAMRAHGLDPGAISWDGKVHRFGKEKRGWYVAFGDGIPGAAFGHWSRGTSETWIADVDHEIDPVEAELYRQNMERAKEERETARAKENARAAGLALKMWEGAESATDHPYCEDKKITPGEARQSGESLLIPIYNSDGELRSVQTISRSGKKKFLSGGEVGGCFAFTGAMGGALYLAEGFADARTIVEKAGGGCFVALMASNLPTVARTLSELGHTFTIIADNGEAGQKAAAKASEETGCRIITPPPEHGDINDFMMAGGDVSKLLGAKQPWLVSYYDAIRQPNPVKWLVKGVLPRRGLAMVHGPSGLGKTFFVLHMALHIASGLEWCGRITRHQSVAYLAGEGHSGLASRLAAWEQQLGNGKTRLHMSRGGAKLDKLDGLNFAIHELRMLPEPPALIVVDTLHRFLSGDENSSQDAGAMVHACDKLAEEFNATVLLVHHTGISDAAQERPRGSSAWTGDLDTRIGLTRAEDAEIITAKVYKQKDGEGGAAHHGTLETVELPWIDEDGDPVCTKLWTPCEAPVETAPRALEAEMDKLQRAWWDSGAEVWDGRPYVATQALERFLVSGLALTERKAKRELDPMKDGLLGKLVAKGVIMSEGHGWAVVDDGLAAIWVAMKG